MEYLSRLCVCLLVFLTANAIEARHLTEKQSDAATRTSKSLTQPRVNFLKTSSIDSAKTKNNNAIFTTSQKVTDTNENTHVPLHTRSNDSKKVNGDVHIDVKDASLGDKPSHRHSVDNPKTSVKGKAVSNNRGEKVTTEYLDKTEEPVPNDIIEDNISGKVDTGPESNQNSGEEVYGSHKHIDEDKVSSNDQTNENVIRKSHHVSRNSDTASILNKTGGDVGDQPNGNAQKIHNWDDESNIVNHVSTHKVVRNPGMTHNTQVKTNIDRGTENGRAKESKTHGSILKSVSKNGDTVLRNSHVNTVVVGDDSTKSLRPKITVFIDEKNDRQHTQRVIASNGDGVIQSRPVRISDTSSHTGGSRVTSSDTDGNRLASSNSVGTRSEHMNESENKNDLPHQVSGENKLHIDAAAENSDSIKPQMAVLESAHEGKMATKHAIEPAETNTNNLHNVDTTDEVTEGSLPAVDWSEKVNDEPKTIKPSAIPTTEKTTPAVERTTTMDKNEASNVPSTVITPTVRKPEDVSPLDIFTSDITYQRFPQPMSLTTFKKKVLGKRLKKLYILEQSEKKLFKHVRQLEAIYTVEEGTLYVSFLFRFVYSRKCQEIPKFKMGKLVGNTDLAIFEKELKDGRTERILFFSERPDDYVFFMSCTDMKTSPYACRDSYYVTLDSAHDPPNQFPWADAAREMESKLSLTFEDPRFIFNFVLLPCARRTSS